MDEYENINEYLESRDGDLLLDDLSWWEEEWKTAYINGSTDDRITAEKEMHRIRSELLRRG